VGAASGFESANDVRFVSHQIPGEFKGTPDVYNWSARGVEYVVGAAG
jgi:hypothetical protein